MDSKDKQSEAPSLLSASASSERKLPTATRTTNPSPSAETDPSAPSVAPPSSPLARAGSKFYLLVIAAVLVLLGIPFFLYMAAGTSYSPTTSQNRNVVSHEGRPGAVILPEHPSQAYPGNAPNAYIARAGNPTTTSNHAIIVSPPSADGNSVSTPFGSTHIHTQAQPDKTSVTSSVADSDQDLVSRFGGNTPTKPHHNKPTTRSTRHRDFDAALLAALISHVNKGAPDSRKSKPSLSKTPSNDQLEAKMRACPAANTKAGIQCRKKVCAAHEGEFPACPAPSTVQPKAQETMR